MLAQYGAPPSLPAHVASPCWQVSAHLPALQISPSLQSVPQAPQLVRSVCVLTHDWPHASVPPPQLLAHLPDEQTSPALQAAAQAPQLAPSVPRVTHALPHWVDPPPQLVEHFPAEQTSPDLQTLPQAPQLVTSCASEVHAPPHTCAPSPQLRPASGMGAFTAVLSLEQATMAAPPAKIPAHNAPRSFENRVDVMGRSLQHPRFAPSVVRWQGAAPPAQNVQPARGLPHWRVQCPSPQ
jgi:hypothetical protein